MDSLFNKKVIIITAVLIILGIGAFALYFLQKDNEEIITPILNNPKYEIIGSSVENRKIESYTYGNGNIHLVFVGGIHGGYEWNSILLAYEFIDYFEANPNFIPENLTISIIPSANPDGVYKITKKEGRFISIDIPNNLDTSSGRFNANEVDLNRNFDCKWQPESTWRSKPVSAGTSAFSEPETQAIRNFILKNNPTAVIFWHSQANAVYASECENGILPETLKIMNIYSKASGYSPIDTFDSYEITGDAEGWLASINIPAITVELNNHQNIDWEENLTGVKALFEYYQK